MTNSFFVSIDRLTSYTMLVESIQSRILAYAAVAIFLLTIGVMIKSAIMTRPNMTTVLTAVIGFILSVGILILRIYDINCVVMGGCGIWAWFKFAPMILLELIVFIVLLVMLFTGNKSNEAAPEEKEEVVQRKPTIVLPEVEQVAPVEVATGAGATAPTGAGATAPQGAGATAPTGAGATTPEPTTTDKKEAFAPY